MNNPDVYEAARVALREKYLAKEPPASVSTAGVDHLALICSDIERTIQFYTDVVNMHLVKVVTNRDDPTSTHIFLDMGGGNQLAFFRFSKTRPGAGRPRRWCDASCGIKGKP